MISLVQNSGQRIASAIFHTMEPKPRREIAMKLPWILVLVLITHSAYAEPTQCDLASFNVEYSPAIKTPWGWEHVTLKITNGTKEVTKQFEYVDFNIACLKNPSSKPYIVYQAYCGGSGCKDFDNWGLIAPSSLKVLLEPSGDNHNKAEEIFGGTLTPFMTRKHASH